MKISLVYANDEYVVVDKPSLMLTVPPRFPDEREILGLQLQEELQQRVWPVHRLDYEVSGLVMFALTPVAHKKANSWFEKRLVHKTYRARCAQVGSWQVDQEVIWQDRIVRGKKRSFVADHGQAAETRARVMSIDHEQMNWDLEPVTGRSHQLRLHMARYVAPILGDQLYGSQMPWLGIALRSFRLDFTDCLQCSLPPRIEVSPEMT